MSIVFWPITCEILKPQKTNGFISHETALPPVLFREILILYFLLEEVKLLYFVFDSHVPCANKKLLSDLNSCGKSPQNRLKNRHCKRRFNRLTIMFSCTGSISYSRYNQKVPYFSSATSVLIRWYSTKFRVGRLRPEAQTLSLWYTNIYINDTPFIT